MQKSAILAFDLDGTVLNPLDRTVSPRVQEALARAQEKGYATSAATGRSLHMMGDNIAQASWVDLLITCNGACVYDARTRDILLCTPVPREVVYASFEALSNFKPCWVIMFATHTIQDERMLRSWARNESIGDSRTEKSLDVLKQIFPDIEVVDDVLKQIHTDPEDVLKYGASFDTVEECSRAIEHLTKLKIPLEIARLSPESLEFTYAGVSKGAAIKKLCALNGWNIQDCLAFGDSGNDLSMSGQGWDFIAMGNSQPEVLKAADAIAPSIADDGVAVWLHDHIL